MTVLFKIAQFYNECNVIHNVLNTTLVSAFIKQDFFCFRTYVQNSTGENIAVRRKFKEQHIQIETCGEVYNRWRKENKYWKVPDGSLKFNVSFVDTAIDHAVDGSNKKSQPTVLALHGAPGSYKDFDILTSSLHKHGIRVIAPSFPDFSVYKPGEFRHSSEEKAQFIKDFLKCINVDKLDLLICHSSAVYPSLRLCAENDTPEIKSLVMLNPGFYSKEQRAVRPYWFLRSIVRLSEFSLGLRILLILGPTLLKVANVPVRVENLLDPLISASVMCFADFPKAKENLQALTSKKFPILFMFGGNDKLIGKDLAHEMAALLGAQESDIFYYDEDGNLTRPGIEKEFLKVVEFEKGSHYVFWKHPEIVNEAIASFLFKYS